MLGESARQKNLNRVSTLDAVFKALSHKTRRQILLTLKHMDGKMTAGEIAGRYSCAWPTISKHLKVLLKAELVTIERQGNHLVYCLNMSPIEDMKVNWLDHL